MKKIITLIASVLLFSTTTFSQVVGIVGNFTNWGADPDVVMTTTDNIQWSANGVIIGVDGGLKFRLDSDWGTNWGGLTFPNGVAELGGFGNDIPGVAGTYDVLFNTNTLEYSFTAVATGFDEVYAVLSGVEIPLVTFDGIDYKSDNQMLVQEGVSFKKVSNGTTTMYGGTAFPGGTAVAAAGQIPNPKGYFNITFNKNTLVYNFTIVPMSIIGDAVIDWDTDMFMTSTDNGVTSKITTNLMVGALKFRGNSSWAINWGASQDEGTMTDTAYVSSAENIMIFSDGSYDIVFNRYTAMYCINPSGTACAIEEGFPAGVGINELSKLVATVFPNPASDVLNFVVNSEFNQIIITDLTGKIIKTTSTNYVNVADVDSGTYIYTVESKEGKTSGRFVKN
jgi:starch-binding outer membrane protein SusE/F